MTVKIGDRAIYRPRVPYGRQSELFCFVTRVIDAEKGIVDLVAFPAGGEFQSINNVAPKGDQIQIHCWEPHVDPLEARISALEDIITERIPASNYTYNEGAEITKEMTVLPQEKRGPGRPRKDAA